MVRRSPCPRRFPLILSISISLFVLFIAATLAPQSTILRASTIVQRFRIVVNHPIVSFQRPLTTSIMASARFQSPPQAPPLFTATADSILADAKKLTERSKSVLDKIAAEVTPETATFGNVLEPWLLDENEQEAPNRILTFYQYVSTSEALREASAKARELINEHYIEVKMREDLFKLVDAVWNKRESEKLSKEQLHILTKERQRFVKNGLLLPAGEKRDRFKEIQKRLSVLAIEANKNLNEEKGGIWYTPDELEGVPKDDIDIETLEQGTDENKGKVKVTFKYIHYTPLMKYAVREETRRRHLIGEQNKLNVNIPLFKEIMDLRSEAAHLLGYPDHASVQIEEKMAKSATNVNKFLGDLRTRLTEGGKKDNAGLLAYKKQDCEARGTAYDGNLYLWDTGYYSRLMKEKEYSVDEIAISQYFPAESTFNGMLKIYEDIFGFVFVELKDEERARLSPTGKAEDIAWFDELLIYSVWDEESAGGEFIGYLYLDLFPRDNKYGHYANFGLEPGYTTVDGKRSYPSTSLVCNFSKPSKTKPSLLKHHEVVTFFHELGHGIHDLASKTRYSYSHGTATTADFVEAPSQMLENWCWTPSVLKNLSRHWDTNEKLPDDLIEKLVKTKHFNTASSTLNQVLIGTFDMKIHGAKSPEEAANINYGTLWNTLRREITGLKGMEDLGEKIDWNHRYASIGHYIGGYDAGYYGYLYSEVFSLDMFYSFFKKDPMDRKEGRRYRHTVLQPGGSIDEMEFLTEYLGRPPSSEAFYQELGLSNTTAN